MKNQLPIYFNHPEKQKISTFIWSLTQCHVSLTQCHVSIAKSQDQNRNKIAMIVVIYFMFWLIHSRLEDLIIAKIAWSSNFSNFDMTCAITE